MIGKEKKQENLEILKRLVTNPRIGGFGSHLWYRSLRCAYPFQFIQLMKKYRNLKKDPEAVRYDDVLISEAIVRVNNAYAVLKKYLLHPPETEEEKKDFEERVDYLEDILLKQNKEN